MRKSILAMLLSAFAVAGCGKDTDSTGSKSPASPAVKPTKPASPANPATQWTGKLEALGPSIHMEGTHKLVDGDKLVVLLKSAKVDLKAHEGKKVAVTGASSATVEGNQTIVDVETIKEIP